MPPDPFRVLGLPRDATQAEVKRAYRRLAKAFHPDAAGDDATARFLEVQAAYETLVAGAGGPVRRGRARSAPTPAREPWRADADRAREAREAGRGRARRGTTGARPPGDAPPGGRRPQNRATPGSTTYDGADQEPFDPDWSGASWYGTTSGTYWTINPREYADPRKHGPEYQARARRQSPRPDDPSSDGEPVEPTPGATAGPSAAPDPSAAAGRSTAYGPSAAQPVDRPGPSAATAGAEAEAGRSAAAGRSAGSRPRPSTDRRAHFATVPPASRAADPPGGPPSRDLMRVLDDASRTVSGRIGLAVVGWLPLGIALGIALGESSGCNPFVEGCEGPFGIATLIGQGSVAALLLLLPRLAVIAALGTIAMFAAAMPSVAALSIVNGPRDPAGVVPMLGLILVAAWAVGAAIGVGRTVRQIAGGGRPPVP